MDEAVRAALADAIQADHADPSPTTSGSGATTASSTDTIQAYLGGGTRDE